MGHFISVGEIKHFKKDYPSKASAKSTNMMISKHQAVIFIEPLPAKANNERLDTESD